MRKWIVGILVTIWLVSVAAVIVPFNIWNLENKEAEEEEDITIDTLDVFIVGDQVSGYDISEDKSTRWYTTFYTVGDFENAPVEFGEAGFMYYDAIKDYTKQTGININLHWYSWPEEMEADLKNLPESEMPDIVLADYETVEDYYLYMDQGVFYDITSYLEEYDMYSGESYYTQVLRGGELHERQYILPILFDVDTVMGSEQSWSEFSLHMEEVQDYDEFLDALIYAQQQEYEGVLAFQYSGTTNIMSHLIYSAAGEQWIDYKDWSANLDKGIFEKMCTFYRQYLVEQMGEDEVSPGAPIKWAEAKEMMMKRNIAEEGIDIFLGDVGCVVEGGASRQFPLRSAAANAWYYENRYTDKEENFRLTPILNNNGGVTAHISYFGGVHYSAEDPAVAFDFLKYLLDTEVSPFFGFSVNRVNTEKQLDEMTSTAFRLRHGLKMLDEEGKHYDTNQDYIMQPLSAGTREILDEMLEQMAVATMPNWPVWEILEKQLAKVAVGEIDEEQAYENAMDELDQYAQTGKEQGIERIEEELVAAEKEEARQAVLSRVMSLEMSEKIAAKQHHERMIKCVKILVRSILFGIAIGIVNLVFHRLDRLNGKVKTERVQIAELDTDNGEAERNIRMTQGGEYGLSSSLGRGVSNMVYLKVYRLDKKNRILRLKLPAEYTRELNEGDIGVLTYIGEEVLTFEKNASIKEEDQKIVKFRV